MKQGLLIIDMQNDYFPGGNMELIAIDEAAANCIKLLEYFRTETFPVYHVQHISTRAGATFFIPDTQGCEIHRSVIPLPHEPVIVKHYPNSFHDTGLHEKLHSEKIQELVICGAMSHLCIDTTVRAAFDLGYACTVISDACETKDLIFENKVIKAESVHTAFMAALSAPFAQVIRTQSYLESQKKL